MFAKRRAGHLSCRRPCHPCLALPRRRPVRRPALTRLWYVRVLDTAGRFEVPSRLFVLPRRCSGKFCLPPWLARGTDVASASQTVDDLSERARPGPAATLCPALPRPARGISGFWTRQANGSFSLCGTPRVDHRVWFQTTSSLFNCGTVVQNAILLPNPSLAYAGQALFQALECNESLQQDRGKTRRGESA